MDSQPNAQVTTAESNQGMGDWVSVEIIDLGGDVRGVQVTLSVNCEEYEIQSNHIRCPAKDAELIQTVVLALFRKLS